MAGFSFRNLLGLQSKASDSRPSTPPPKTTVVGADNQGESIQSFDNSNITYTSALTDIDYDAILRDKQNHINDLYKLADYYTDADPIVHGINKHVYVPFTTGDYFLVGNNEKTIEIFEDYYSRIRIRELIDDIALQYYKYGNVVVYVFNGVGITLPPHKCKIANISYDGVPIVDYNVDELKTEFRQRTYTLLEQPEVKDALLQDILKGYPPEIAEAIRENKSYARLNPHNTFVIQGSKEKWMRYSIPWISAALFSLARKERITNYENSLLNIGSRSFVHVTYGDSTKDRDLLPDVEMLRAVRNIFANAMKGNPLAVTNNWAKAEVVQADLSDLYQFPLYSQVNSEILAAGGIAGIIVNGESEEGSTFASAQVSMQAAACRIESARREIEDFMRKFNERIVEDIKLVRTNNLKQIPVFRFKPLSMNGNKDLREACEKLWNLGVISNQTLLEQYGYNMAKEKQRRQNEASDGTDDALMQRSMQVGLNNDEDSEGGRPVEEDDERTSDPENAIRSKQAKDAEDGDIVDS